MSRDGNGSTGPEVAAEAVALAISSLRAPAAAGVFRLRRHGDVRAVATWVSQLEGTRPGSPPPHIVSLLQPAGSDHIDGDTVVIADGFLELNEKREQADYDHDGVFTRADTLTQIAWRARSWGWCRARRPTQRNASSA